MNFSSLEVCVRIAIHLQSYNISRAAHMVAHILCDSETYILLSLLILLAIQKQLIKLQN